MERGESNMVVCSIMLSAGSVYTDFALAKEEKVRRLVTIFLVLKILNVDLSNIQKIRSRSDLMFLGEEFRKSAFDSLCKRMKLSCKEIILRDFGFLTFWVCKDTISILN